MNREKHNKNNYSLIYVIYRRIRFLFYKRKVLKQKQKNLKQSEELEQKALQENIKKQQLLEKQRNKNSNREIIRQEKLEKKEINHKLREQKRIERQRQKNIDKIKKREEIEEKKKVKEIIKKQRSQEIKASFGKRKLEKEEVKNQKKELKEDKKKISESNFVIALRILFSFNFSNIKLLVKHLLGIPEHRSQKQSYWIISLNSLIIFLLSYFVIFYVGQFTTLVVARSFDYNLIFFYHKIFYSIAGGDWTPDAVKILYSITPLTGLFMGVVSIFIYSAYKETEGLLKLFFLWSFINGMSVFFGALLFGTLLNQGFGWVIAWLYFRDTGKMIFALLAVFSLLAVGRFSARSLFISGNTYFNFIDQTNRKFFFFSQVILPIFFGTFLIIILKLPTAFYYQTFDETLFEILKTFSAFIIFIPVITTFRGFDTVYFSEEKKKTRIAWSYVIVFFILIIGIRIIFNSGIRFG